MESVYDHARHQQRAGCQGKCQRPHIASDCKGPGRYLSVFVYLQVPKTIGQGDVVKGERRELGKKREASRKGGPAQSPPDSRTALGSHPSKRELWPHVFFVLPWQEGRHMVSQPKAQHSICVYQDMKKAISQDQYNWLKVRKWKVGTAI